MSKKPKSASEETDPVDILEEIYLKYLCSSFAYLDLVWHDTPFSKRGVAGTLAKLIYSKLFEDRFKRVEIFLEYLRGHETRELEVCGLGKKRGAFGPFMPNIEHEFQKQKAEISKKVRQTELKFKN